MLLAQLGPYGKKKGVRAEKHLHSYLNEKIDTFVNSRVAGNQQQSNHQQPSDFPQIGRSSLDVANEVETKLNDSGEFQTCKSAMVDNHATRDLKVIIVTIACCDRMQDIAGIWEQLKDYLTSKLDELSDSNHQNDIVYCLNIHNEGQKVPMSTNESISPQIWEQWKDQFQIDKMTTDPLLLADDFSKIKVYNFGGMDALTEL